MNPAEELALLNELEAELREMDEDQLEKMTSMVLAERQRRAGGMPKYQDVETLKADVEGVKELVSLMTGALDARLADETKPAVKFMDSFMACVNTSRFVLQTIEDHQGFTVDQKKAFRLMFVATLERSLMSRLMN